MAFDFSKDISSMTDEEIKGVLRELGLENIVEPNDFRKRWEAFKEKEQSPKGSAGADDTDVTFFKGQMLLLMAESEEKADKLVMLYTLQIFEDLLSTLIFTCTKLYGNFPVLINISAINDKNHPEHHKHFIKFYILATELLSHLNGARLITLVQPCLSSLFSTFEREHQDTPDFPVEHPSRYNMSLLVNFGLKILQSMKKVAMFNNIVHRDDKLGKGIPLSEIEYICTIVEQEGAILIDVDSQLKKMSEAFLEQNQA
jgi:hypothetical protein